MRTTGRHGWVGLIALSLAMGGCGKPPVAAYPTWIPNTPAYTPSTTSANAFDSYARAAEDAERVGGEYLNRVFFTPGMKERAIELMAPAISQVRQGASNQCEFRFVPRRPFTQPPYARGWRLIGHAMVWSIEQACAEANYDAAVTDAIAATKLGFDLTGGSALDASLGLTLANETRKAIAGSLLKLSPAQLGRLGAGIKRALEEKPPMTLSIANERLNMLAAVQTVQDAYRDHRLDGLRAKLGGEVKEAIQYLEDLRDEDAKKRPPYFEGFAEEANKQAEWITKMAQLPASERTETGPTLREQRPWRRFAKQFFHAPDMLLAQDDQTVARTRLLILTAEIQRQVRSGKPAPINLNLFTKSTTIDPYTGLPFVYRAEGLDFKLYSVGSDFKDDGGETDETGTKPDLVLEGS